MNMKSDCLLSIIIVNYNSRELLKNCLQSIQSNIEIQEVEIFVADNDSHDGSVEMVRNNFPEVEIIANESNVGYSKAINQAIRPSLGKYILILNADTIVTPGAIQTLLSFMENHPDCGVSGPKLSYPDGKLQYSCRTYQTFKTILFRRTILGNIFPGSKVLRDHLMLDWDHCQEREVDWLQGSALMVRRSSINQTGPMDERYFLYFEDVDLCYRMKNGGWKVRYVPQAEVIHYYRRASYGKSIFNRDLLVHLTSMLRYHDKWSKVLYMAKRCIHTLKFPALFGLDCVGLLISFWLAFSLRESIGAIGSKPLYPISIYWQPLLIFAIFILSIYYFLGLYENKRHQSWIDRLFSISKGTLISCLVMVLFHFFSEGYQLGLLYSRIILVSFAIINVLVTLFIHQSVHFLARFLWRHGFNLKRSLIVGTDPTAIRIGKMLTAGPDFGYDLVGFISLPESSESPKHLQIIGGVDNLVEICLRERIQEVVFVNVEEHFENIVLPLTKFRKELINTRIISNDSESKIIDTRIKDFFGFPSLEFERGSYYYLALGLKRLTDIFIALFSIILLSPLIFFIYLLLKIEGGGVFFTQKRVGKSGKEFCIYKFKSMIDHAEKVKKHLENVVTEGPIFKVKNDPRVTPVGRILRRYNLDEIPQLINVLKGHMSIIGPRPPLPEEVAAYERWHEARLEIKPGITGLWQVDKERKWKFDEMVRMDIFYILNWSPLLDIKILFRTPGAMLRSTGFNV
jgi:exopolysaccharide biosynthesis polyprenyl glycosylphosphotransferase